MVKSQPRFLDLKSGLRIAYEEYGDPAGEPVFFCHGWPSSRTMAAILDEAAQELGIRVISPDRPGIALSQSQPGRTVLDWPPVIAGMTEALGIEHYRVLGVSGGAPYTFATAWANPTAVKAIAVISGAPPLAGHDAAVGLLVVYTWLLRIYRVSPRAVRFLFTLFRPLVLHPVMKALKPLLLVMQNPYDRAALSRKEAFEICYESSHEAWKSGASGASGVITDAELYAHPWGFDLCEIKVPVLLWHGKQDNSFSWKLAEAIAEKIPGCTTNFVENEGHYSLPIMHVRSILEALKNAG